MNVDESPIRSRRKLPGVAGATGRHAALLAAPVDVFAIELVYLHRVIRSQRETAMAQVPKMKNAKCQAVIVSIFFDLKSL